MVVAKDHDEWVECVVIDYTEFNNMLAESNWSKAHTPLGKLYVSIMLKLTIPITKSTLQRIELIAMTIFYLIP